MKDETVIKLLRQYERTGSEGEGGSLHNYTIPSLLRGSQFRKSEWYKAGILQGPHNHYITPTQFLFDDSSSDDCMCTGFITCPYYSVTLCFKNFFESRLISFFAAFPEPRKACNDELQELQKQRAGSRIELAQKSFTDSSLSTEPRRRLRLKHPFLGQYSKRFRGPRSRGLFLASSA